MALLPWLDTSVIRSGKYRPHFRWWFILLVIDFIVLMWAGSRPAEGIYGVIALIGSTYWFVFFLVIMPLLGILESPNRRPATIEEDFSKHYPPSSSEPLATEQAQN